MATIRIPDDNTADIVIEDGSEDTYVIGDNNCGRIIIKGDFNGKLKIGKGNKADIEVEGDNEGEITVGDDNEGDIHIGDVNEGDIKVGNGNKGKIRTGDDNEGEIETGDGNEGDIDIGDVNQGDIKLGDGNKGDIDVDDDNEGDIDVGDDNEGDVTVGDANQGDIKIGKRNKGKIRTGDDNEDDISIGDDNKGDVRVGGDNDEDITAGENNCGDIVVVGDNNGTITVGAGNDGTIDPRGDEQGTVRDPGKNPCKKFFAEYDKRFFPGSPDAVVPASATAVLLGVLAAIFQLREEAAQSDNEPDLSSIQDRIDAIKDIIEFYSEKQLELYEDCFGDGAGGLDLDAIQACFAAFANGELRDPDRPEGSRGARPGEPDGSFFFLFAEFAMLAIECGFDVAKWEQILPSLLKVLEIFIQVYEPTDNLTGVARGRARSGPRVTKERKKSLHGEYGGKTIDELKACLRELLRRSRAQRIGEAPRPSHSTVDSVSEVGYLPGGGLFGEEFAGLFRIDGTIRLRKVEKLIQKNRES